MNGRGQFFSEWQNFQVTAVNGRGQIFSEWQNFQVTAVNGRGQIYLVTLANMTIRKASR